MNFHMCVPLAAAALPLPAASALHQLEKITFKNVEIGRRHPVAIYAMAIRSVVDAFDDALTAYQALVLSGLGDESPPDLQKALIQKLDLLLDAIAEHFDDAKCCLQLVLEGDADKKLTRPLRDYEDSIRHVRGFCTTQVNEMKHRQGRVQLIHIEFAASILWGYFIQGVGKHGEIGPNPRVHKTNTAYSFSRAFRMLAAAVLFTSRALASALYRQTTHSLTLAPSGFGMMRPVVERIASLPRVVFWDEIHNCPDFRVSADALEVKAPAGRRWKRPSQDARIKFVFVAESINMPYRLPYMGNYMKE